MVAVAVEEFRPIRAHRVPVDKHGFGVSFHPFCDHLVVRILPGAGDLYVDEHDPIDAGEYTHDLVELPFGEGAVVAEVDDLRVDDPEPAYIFLQSSDGA